MLWNCIIPSCQYGLRETLSDCLGTFFLALLWGTHLITVIHFKFHLNQVSKFLLNSRVPEGYHTNHIIARTLCIMFVHQYDLTFNAHCRTFYQVFLYTQSQQPAPKKVFKFCGQLLSNSRQKLEVILENRVVLKLKF